MGRQQRNIKYTSESEDCEYGREDAPRAVPSCRFNSIDNISFVTIMKRE
jgi:hypothetical protein